MILFLHLINKLKIWAQIIIRGTRLSIFGSDSLTIESICEDSFKIWAQMMKSKWRIQQYHRQTEWLHELLVGGKKRDKLASDRETHIPIPSALIYSCCLQSFDRRRISTCSGYSTGQASLGSPRRISGASYSSEERGLGEVRELRPEPGQRSQHWRYSFRRYSEYYLI